jgi:hypothetical protein
MLTAFEDGAPVWATLTIKGTVANRTPLGEYRIVTQVRRETMDSETLRPPIPRVNGQQVRPSGGQETAPPAVLSGGHENPHGRCYQSSPEL